MPSDDSPLLFRHPSRALRRRPLRAFWRDLTQYVGKAEGAVCLITTDPEVRELNRKFRKKNSATDVLSFPAVDGAGDIAISLDRAAEQAKEQGHSLDEELRILMLHGVLHLNGMDHEKDSGEMARAELRWRKRLGLPSGLIERQ